MKKSCTQCSTSFEVTDDDMAFYDRVSPVIAGKKYAVPPPTLCPDCRSRRRMAWRNERHLYTHPCGLCRKTKVSMFQPGAPYRAYCNDCYYGDGWDALSCGRDYDFSKTFAENMDALLHDVPLMMLFLSGVNENCEYTNYFGPDSRNCYLMHNSGRDEDCMYGRGLIESKSCLDMLIGNGNQFCCECVNASECYRTFYSQNVAQCTESAFLFNCRRCKNCFGCSNLVQKEYHLWNKPCTPEEFKTQMDKLHSASFVAESRQKLEDLKRKSIHRENNNINAENCTGDYMTSSKNCKDSYETKGSEDCKWLLCSKLCKDSYDLFGFGYDSELLYESVGSGLSTALLFSWICTSVNDSAFCLQCNNLQNCFGCVSLRHKKYCIFNKQYTKEQYEELVPKIIAAMQNEKGPAMNRSAEDATGSWGEWLPWTMSPFGYNETVAQEFLPLTRDEAVKRGFRWNDASPPPPEAKKTIPAGSLPDSLNDIPDDVLNWAIVCEETKKPFKITKQELDFYREMHLPLPHVTPNERHRRRMALRNPVVLHDRTCDKCRKAIRTTYAPGRPESIYCEACYLATVY